MKKKNISSLFESFKEVKMTQEEKKETWDGVLRRATDFPDGNSPFKGSPSTWDGVFRRKTDFPEDATPPSLDNKETPNSPS